MYIKYYISCYVLKCLLFFNNYDDVINISLINHVSDCGGSTHRYLMELGQIEADQIGFNASSPGPFGLRRS